MFYDVFSSDYDKFVNWQGRLSSEMPFLEETLRKNNVSSVLDTACGTGMHAIQLAKDGFKAFGCDLSSEMVKVASKNANDRNLLIEFFQAGFGELVEKAPTHNFDAVLCLGNSLPHVADLDHLKITLADFYQALSPGGTLVLQERNFDAVMQAKDRWMDPQYARDDTTETLFHRFYDFESDGSINFNVMITKREIGKNWGQQVITTRLFPILAEELRDALKQVGFTKIQIFGDLTGSPYDPDSSPNHVVIAVKQ